MEVKSVAIIAPFLNAILYGLYYALLEQNYQKLTMPTAWLLTGAASLTAVIVMVGLKIVPIDFSPLADRRTLLLALAMQVVGVSISIFMYIAIKYTSATYMAFAEIAYPFFVPLFVYLLFGVKEMNWTTAVGGTLTVAGCAVLLYGKLKVTG